MTLDSQIVLASVEQKGPPGSAVLAVDLACENPSPQTRLAAESALIRLLGLDVDLSGFYAMAFADAQLAPLAEKFIGVRPPLYPTLFESIANAIVLQQISLDAGMSVLNRLTEIYGARFNYRHEVFYLFPEVRCLAGLGVEEIRRAGLTANKARALAECAGQIMERGLSLEYFEEMDNETAFNELVKFRGIGRWSADYILLRGLGRLDVFPQGDIGARARLNSLLRSDGKLSDLDVANIVKKWQGYGGIVYFHLLLSGLADKGLMCLF